MRQREKYFSKDRQITIQVLYNLCSCLLRKSADCKFCITFVLEFFPVQERPLAMFIIRPA